MTGDQDEIDRINAATLNWRQGDLVLASDLVIIHLADLRCPLVGASREIASLRKQDGQELELEGVAGEADGLVVLTQTCDIVRDCKHRPFVEVALLRKVDPSILKEARILRRPAFAYLPKIADKQLVADLDQVMTVEKSLLANWVRITGCDTDQERQVFSEALARHRSRYAFPDDFNLRMRPIQQHIKRSHDKQTDEGELLRSIMEIRVHAEPDWDAGSIRVFFWFILSDAGSRLVSDRASLVERWLGLFTLDGRFSVEGVVCRLEDMSAADYYISNRLDLDSISSA